MTDRFVAVLVADEIYYNLHGKAILQGIYNADITLASESQQANQLVFFFMIETDIANPFRALQVQVTLPGNEPVLNHVPVQWPMPLVASSERKKIFVKWPLLIPAPMLRPGRIEAKAIHEDGELIAAAPWIVSPQTVTASAVKIQTN